MNGGPISGVFNQRGEQQRLTTKRYKEESRKYSDGLCCRLPSHHEVPTLSTSSDNSSVFITTAAFTRDFLRSFTSCIQSFITVNDNRNKNVVMNGCTVHAGMC